MYDGLWIIEFESMIQHYGKGILVLNNGRLLGGDDGYYYHGTYRMIDNRFEGTATVIKHDPNSISVFGNIGHFEITLVGEITGDYQFKAVGNIMNNPEAKITITGIKKVDI